MKKIRIGDGPFSYMPLLPLRPLQPKLIPLGMIMRHPISPPIPNELYDEIFSMLDAASLRNVDATCRIFRFLTRNLGTWRSLGAQKFAGIELEDRGTFEGPMGASWIRSSHAISTQPTPLCVRRTKEKSVRTEINWKMRYVYFSKEVYEFRCPFDPIRITTVLTPDEVAYTKCRLRADVLTANPHISIYLEVEVEANADNLSLAIVDFDEGGKSSVTFSPDTGAVIKETKVQESPRRVKGSYIQPVKPNFTKFEGKMGMYVRMGLIAFFRQYHKQPWETTGFCVNFSWAKGKRLTPCLAFRDEGKYFTRITKVSATPPFEPHWDVDSFDDSKWDELNWEGGPAT